MKSNPLLAIHMSRWRRAIGAIPLACLATLPFAWLWPEWMGQIGRALTQPFGIVTRVPLAVRMPVGLLLVLSRRPVPRALGAVIATPAFYLHTFALLLAPLALLRPDVRPGQAGDAAAVV